MKSLKVRGADLLRLVSQMAIMLEVGVTAYDMVRSLASTEPNRKLKNFLSSVEANLGSGMRLSEAVSMDPTPFSEGEISMIEAGEAGGFLPKVLTRIAQTLETREELKKQIKGALMFPLATIICALGILVFMLIKIVPQFADLFAESGVALPGATQFVINLSKIATAQPIFTILLTAAIAYLIIRLPAFVQKTPGLQDLVIKLPVIGQFIIDSMTVDFFIMMGQLIGSGVTLEKSLTIAMGLNSFKVYQNTVDTFIGNIRSGINLSSSMENSIFGPNNAQMVKTGEQSGRLADVMSMVGARYEKELRYKLKIVTTYAELFAIATAGAIVGLIAYAMFSPLLNISSVVK